MERNVKPIDHAPTPNNELVTSAMAQWLLAIPFLPVDERAARDIERFPGCSYLNVTLGGYAPHPDVPGKTVSCETSFSVEMGGMHQFDDEYEDPSGDRWYRYRPGVQVGWPSYGSTTSWKITQMRAALIATTVELGDRFLAQFGQTDVWVRGSTKAQRDEIELNGRKSRTQAALAEAIKVAIHTTCRFMKVGNERWVKAPAVSGGIVPGEYTVEVENKTYRVNVQPDGRDMDFMRTK